jgi:hypothetical protein
VQKQRVEKFILRMLKLKIKINEIEQKILRLKNANFEKQLKFFILQRNHRRKHNDDHYRDEFRFRKRVVRFKTFEMQKYVN